MDSAQSSIGRTVALTVDLQNGFLHPAGSMARLGRDVERLTGLVPAIDKLLTAVRQLAIPIIYTQHAYRQGYPERGRQLQHMAKLEGLGGLLETAWDAEFLEELRPHPDDIVVVKRRYDAFLGTDLELLLRSLAAEHLVVVGVNTNMCVESTVRSAAQRDFRVTVVSDCTGAPDPELHKAALRSMAYAFAQVAPMERVLSELE